MASPPPVPNAPSPWGPLTIPEGRAISVRIGPRDIQLRADDGEIWVAHASTDPPPAESSPAEPHSADFLLAQPSPIESPLSESPMGESVRARSLGAEPEWSRWATPGGEKVVSLRPSFPDRSLVLEPERPFRLLPGAETRIFVRVPLWVRLELPLGDRGGSLVLTEFPVVPLSDTWWGGFMDGELAYWLNTTARRRMRSDLFAPYLAVCPLTMTNHSAGQLPVEKLTLRVAHLSLFAHGDHLWADEATVTYQGDGEGSVIEVSGRPPPEAEGGTLVTPPRTPSGRSFRARTFQRLRGLPGMGAG